MILVITGHNWDPDDIRDSIEWAKANGFDPYAASLPSLVDLEARTISFERHSYRDGETVELAEAGKSLPTGPTEWVKIPLLVDPPASIVGTVRL